MPSIERSDLVPVLGSHDGDRAFLQTLERIASGEDVLRLLGRYIHFNSVFGGGVANLAGEIAVRQDLFRDPAEPVEVLADRSVEVASDIFFAAVDEFDDRVTAYRDTHRTLAQATLRGAGQFYGCDSEALNRIARLNEATLLALRNVRDGYGVSQTVGDRKLFTGIGFHLGSELLADEEFSVLDRYLRARHPELVSYLEKTRVPAGGHDHAAYFWIRVHTSVEIDHFDAAVKGANTALRFYTGDAERAKEWLLEGVDAFAGVQAGFIAGLMD